MKLYGNTYMISMKISHFREFGSVTKDICPGKVSFELFIERIAVLSLVLVSMDLYYQYRVVI